MCVIFCLTVCNRHTRKNGLCRLAVWKRFGAPVIFFLTGRGSFRSSDRSKNVQLRRQTHCYDRTCCSSLCFFILCFCLLGSCVRPYAVRLKCCALFVEMYNGSLFENRRNFPGFCCGSVLDFNGSLYCYRY